MSAIKTFLWVQIVLGLLGGFLALVAMHAGAMTKAWAYNLQVEHDKLKQAPDYREPAIRARSLEEILVDYEASGSMSAEIGFYWLLTCGALVFSATIIMRLV